MPEHVNYQFTQVLDTIFDQNQKSLQSYYCREDFENLVQEVKSAGPDAIRFRMNDLRQLCQARELDMAALLKNPAMLEEIPTRAQVQERLLQLFYDLYLKTAGTSMYIERLVRRLVPENTEDSIRLVILKQFLKGFSRGCSRFDTGLVEEWVLSRLPADRQSTYARLDQKEKTAVLIQNVKDEIFDLLDREIKPQNRVESMGRFIQKYKENTDLHLQDLRLNPDIQKSLHDFLKPFGLQPAPFIQQIEELLPALYQDLKLLQAVQENRTLFEKLESEFASGLKKRTYMTRAGRKQPGSELYKQFKKDAQKEKNSQSELLSLCDDLAKGSFRVNGKTRVYLYYFALMFDMTIPRKQVPYDPERDMVRHLLEDYYNDNLIRMLQSEYADPRQSSSLENEPTGEGINYKNFTEVIYAWFLCHPELEMTPGEKIDAAEKLIDQSIRLTKKKPQDLPELTVCLTRDYRDHHFYVLLNKTMEEIPDYIAAHYMVTDPDNPRQARILSASRENAAHQMLSEFLQSPNAGSAAGALDMQGHFSSREAREDFQYEDQWQFEWKLKELLQNRFAEDPSFVRLIEILDGRVCQKRGRLNRKMKECMLMIVNILQRSSVLSFDQLKSRLEDRHIYLDAADIRQALLLLIEAGLPLEKTADPYGKDSQGDYYRFDAQSIQPEYELLLKLTARTYFHCSENAVRLLDDLLGKKLKGEERVTRNELIAAYLPCYIDLLNETEGLDTFPAVFEDFSSTMEPILEEARYQKISTKNIFDMYIVVSIYLYLLENSGRFS